MKLSYTISELCQETGLGRTFLYARIAAGDLVRIKAGSRTLVTGDSARAYIQRLAEQESGVGRKSLITVESAERLIAGPTVDSK